MKINVGSTDRILRISLGLILVLLAFTGVISAWGYLGIVAVFTGFFRFCPLYPLLGINTCSRDSK
jgi:hypothetical protein